MTIVAERKCAYGRIPSYCAIPCTKCEYCLSCTVELNIPRLFDVLNHGVMYNKLGEVMHASGTLA